MVRRTVTTILCTGLGTTLWIGLESTTVISAYFHLPEYFQCPPVHGNSAVPFLFVPPRGRAALEKQANTSERSDMFAVSHFEDEVGRQLMGSGSRAAFETPAGPVALKTVFQRLDEFVVAKGPAGVRAAAQEAQCHHFVGGHQKGSPSVCPPCACQNARSESCSRSGSKPRWMAALDHSYCSACATRPTRAGLRST